MREWSNFKDAMSEDDETEEDIQSAFEAYDVDRDGYITREEVKRVLAKLGTVDKVEEEAEKCIREMDLNGDGKVSFAEFMVKWRLA